MGMTGKELLEKYNKKRQGNDVSSNETTSKPSTNTQITGSQLLDKYYGKTSSESSKDTPTFTFSEEGKSGWQKFLEEEEAKKNAPKHDINGDGKDSWWENIIGWLGEGSVDTTLPTAGVTQTINDLRVDQSHRRPTDDWTDEQRDTFGKFYLESPEKAYSFAESTNKQNNEAKEKAETEKIQSSATSDFWSGAGHTIGAIATAPLGMADFLYDLALSTAGRDIAPDGNISPFEYSQAVTGGISQDLNDTYGVIDESVPIIGGKGWGDVYGLGTSIAQSAVSGLTLGSAGTLISYFGQGAASGVDEALSRGATEGQAALYGVALGTFEGVAEMIGIDNLFNIGSSATVKEAIKNVLRQAGAEGLEEGLTSICSNVMDDWIMSDKSNFHLLVNELMAQGMSREEAKKKAWLDSIEGILYDTLGGFVSGGVHAGVATGIQTSVVNAQNKKYFGDQAQAMVNEAVASEDASVKSVGEKYQQKVNDGKKLSGWNITELLEVTDTSKIKSAVEARLTELGETGDVSKIADAITKQAMGYDLKVTEKKAIQDSKYGYRVATEVDADNVGSGSLANKWAENIGTRAYNVESYNKAAYDLAMQKAGVLEAVEKASVAKSEADIESEAGAKFEASEDGKTTYTDIKGNVRDVTIKKIASTEGGLKVELEDGTTVNASDLSFGTKEEALMYEMVARMEVTPETANEIISAFKPSNVEQASRYFSTIPLAYRYGQMGYEAGLKNVALPDNLKKIAYNRGRMDAIVQDKSKTKTATKKDGANASTKKGSIIFEGGYVYDESNANDLQKASMAGIEVISKMSNLEVHVFESYVNEKGERVYKVNGVEKPAPNGYYAVGGNQIYVDINAGNGGEGAMLYAMSHEIGHYIREWNAKGFRELGDFLLKEYGKRGVPVQTLLNEQKEKIKKRYERDGLALPSEAKLNDMAYEEVVCDAMSDMLADEGAYEKLAKLKQQNRTLWQKLGEAIKALLDKLKGALGVYKEQKVAVAQEAFAVRGFDKKTFDKLQDLYIKAFVEADNNFSNAEKTLADNGIAVNPDTNSASLLSVRDVLDDDQQKKVAKALAERFGVTQAEAMDWLKAETSMASLILNPKYSQYLDYTPDPNEVAIKQNSDYPQGTVDFSPICAKRREFTSVMNNILRLFPNHVFAATDLAKIRSIMQEEGMTIPCGICYVEDRRQLDTIVAQNFIDSLKLYREGSKTRPDGKPFNTNQLKGLSLIDGDTYTPSVYELVSLEGLNVLKEKNPNMAEAWVKFNNARGMQSVRLLANEAEYKRQILKYTKKTVQSKNDKGGLRVYSFSDAEMFHLIDIIQVITDSATVGLYLQGYTKVNEYARTVKDTGEKLNRSLIPKGELGYHIENGKVVLDYDTVEGIDINHPDFFDNRDNPDVGNITIGVSDVQIRAAMVSDFVDQIIPFHTGQSEEVLGEKGIATWSNYKDFQTEKDIATGNVSEHQINIYTEVLQELEKEGTTITKRTFVEKFLQVCKDNGLTPRFSQFLNTNEKGEYVYTEGYHKMLVDFKTFAQTEVGEYLPQRAVKPIFDNEYITKILKDYVKSQKVKDAELTKSMPKVIERITNEIVKPGETKYSDRDTATTIYIKDGHTANGKTVDFVNLILDGKKKGETRSHNKLTRKWVGIAKDGYVYGRVRLGEPYLIGKDSPEYRDSYIKGTEYDLKDNEKKYYYPILETEDFRSEPKPIEKNGNYGTYRYSDRVLMGSLFSGGGTLEAGLVYQMVDKEFAVEYNRKIASVYTDNHGKEHMFVGDVRDFDSKEKQNVFYLHASPVCKNFSPASHSGGETTLDITTAQATARVLEEQMPQVFTVENVKRYIGSEAYNIIVNKLNELGYTWDVDVYKASDYGNATKRERMIIRAVRDGQLPAKPQKDSTITSWGEATRDLWETDLIPSYLVKSKIEAIKNTPGLKGVKLTKLDKPLLIYDTTKSKTINYAWADQLAPTLTTKCGDARIIMPDGRVYAPTPKFMGRIQGLPDDYKYPKANTNAFKIIGNGIPTQLTKAVMGGVLDSAYEQTHEGQKLYSDRDSYAPTFYSHMGKVVDGIKAEKMGANDVVSYLKGRGVKDEEIKWSGIETFLEGKKSVTKAELQEFVAGSQLQIEEEEIGKGATDKKELWDNFRREMGDVLSWLSPEEIDDMCFDDNGDFSADKFKEELQVLVDDGTINEWTYEDAVECAAEMEQGLKAGGTRWGKYKLSGGSNYREFVFKMPGSDYTNASMQNHWGNDAKGVLAHARVQDMTTANGKQMLFIEEIQSDWHNEGHKRGYKRPGVEVKSALARRMEEHAEEFHNSGIAEVVSERISVVGYEGAGVDMILNFLLDSVDSLNNTLDILNKKGATFTESEVAKLTKYAQEYDELYRKWQEAPGDFTPPEAPFKKNYHEYVLKRLLRMAAEEGYDYIGWTTADIQMDRWNPDRRSNLEMGIRGTKNPNAVAFEEGYRIEYDRGMPNFLSSYADKNKWGANVGKTWIEAYTSSEEDFLVWSMDITDSMKESVLYEGQVLYSERDPNAVSNRTLLAGALESVAQNDIEKKKLDEYKAKIALIEAEQKKLGEIRAKANELRFTKGRTPAETKQMKDLDFEAAQIANRINVYDKQLLSLESTTALKNVLEREKTMLRKRLEQKGKQALKDQKAKDAETIRELMNRHTESRKKAIEGRHKTEVRGKIKKVVSELNRLLLNPTKEKHIPIGLQFPVAEALDAINMDTMNAEERVAYYNDLLSKTSDPDEIEMLTQKRDFFAYRDANFKERITALKNAYAEFKESDDPLIRNAHNEAIEDLIKNTADVVGNKSLKDMSYEQLEAVYRMYKAILATVRNANKMFKEGIQETVTQNSEDVKVQVKEVGGHQDRVLKLSKFFKKFGWDMLKPVTAMKVIGSKTFERLFNNVRAGEDTWAVDVGEAKTFYDEATKKYNFSKWDFKKRYTFKDNNGDDFSISLEQIMSLYAYSKRDQADKHLEFGGFIFDDAIEVTEKKLGIPLKYEVNDANPHRLRMEDVLAIAETLTQEQKAFVDEMQTYLSDVMGAKGNEVSLAMYDIKLYNEKNYFPLKTSRYFREFDPEKSGTPRIKNSGFSKKTVPQAGNPIVLSNFMDVWAGHVNDMSMYHAFVLPLEDFMRVYNYSSTAGGYDSVQQYIKNAYGSQANQYIERLMDDLNGGARVDSSAGVINKGLSLFKRASVFASASVVVQQPSAIARALAYINPKYFVTSTASAMNVVKHKKVWAEVKKYAPVAVIKEMGYFDTGMGRSTVEWIKGDKTIKDKMDDALSKAPAIADELVWCHIWEAVKRETADTKKIKAGTEDFYEECGRRFTEVITNTQVYDSVLSRSGMMRSKDTGMKMATAFMAEPTTTVNMMVDGIIQGKRGNKKFTAATVGAVASSVILNSILVALVYAARDDDEDETYAEKYIGSVTTELLDGFNPLTYVPFIKDIWSIAQGYDVERSDMSVVSKLWESVEGLFKEDKSGLEKVLDVTGSVSSLFGIPLKNIIRDAKGMYNLTLTLTSGTQTTGAGITEAVEDSFKSSIPLWDRLTESKSNADRLYEAILSGDKVQIERVKSRYKDENAIESAMRQALRDNDSRIKEAAQARYEGDISEYTRIAKQIIAEGKFSQDTIVAAINAELNAIKKGETVEVEENEEKDEVTSIYSSSDINSAFDNGDTDMALEIINDLIETKVANGKTEKEAKTSIRSSMTSYWKPLYKAAYQNGDTDEMYRIRTILHSSGLYGSANDVVKTVASWLKS